jgi:two-component system cell cycle sensor histidine kinase/response regulator CckA
MQERVPGAHPPTPDALARLLRATPVALLAFDSDDHAVVVNAAVRDLLGDEPADVRHLVDLLGRGGADELAVVPFLESLRVAGQGPVQVDLPVRGRRVVIDVTTADPLRVVTIVDVTRLDREEVVRADLVEAMDHAPIGAMLLTPIVSSGRVVDFEVTYANRVMQRMHGGGFELGRRLNELIGPLGHPSFPRYRSVWETKEGDVTTTRFEAEGIDEWYDVRVVATPHAVLVALESATERKRAIDRLEENEKLLRTSQEVADLGSFEWFVGRDELRWTDQMYDVVQVDRDAFDHSYEAFIEFIHPDDRQMVDDMLRESIGHDLPYSGDLRRLMPDGSVRILHSEARMVYERGKEPRFVGTLQDVTQARELEEAIRRTQRVESLGQMAAGVAHDFNNILTLVTMHAHLMREELEAAQVTDEVLEDLAGIEDAVGRATNLTRQLLAFTGQQVRRPTVLDLGTVVGDVVPMLTRLTGVDIVLDVDAEAGVTVRADRTQIEQVVLNLVLNARDAIDGAGSIGIRVCEVDADHATVTHGGEHAPADSRWALLEVRDDGHGMSEHVREHALDPFFTTKPQGKGTGLGLSVVFGIVTQSGGRFAIETEVGAGTTMSVALPLAGDSPRREPPAATADTSGTETVLIVEDDLAVRELAARTLREYGYQVIHAEDGEEALVLLAVRPDVAAVVTDVAMPRMGGIELHRAVREKHPDVALLLMSGYTRPDALPDDDRTVFVAKPLTGGALSAALREALDR